MPSLSLNFATCPPKLSSEPSGCSGSNGSSGSSSKRTHSSTSSSSSKLVVVIVVVVALAIEEEAVVLAEIILVVVVVVVVVVSGSSTSSNSISSRSSNCEPVDLLAFLPKSLAIFSRGTDDVPTYQQTLAKCQLYPPHVPFFFQLHAIA